MNQRMRQEKIQEVEKGLAVKAGDKDYTGAARLQAELAALTTCMLHQHLYAGGNDVCSIV